MMVGQSFDGARDGPDNLERMADPEGVVHRK